MTVHLKEERCTGGKTKIICSGSKFKHILNSLEKVFYSEDSIFSYTACIWIEAQAIETGKYIHQKMCGHSGERMVTVWVLNDKGKKNKHLFWMMDMNLKRTQCIKRPQRQQKRYEDTCQIDWLIENNGWDTKYNLVSTWECEEPILKKVRLEKKFKPYPHFIVYDFDAILARPNEHPTNDLAYNNKRCRP